MKVMMDGERLTEIGKTLPSETVNAEAIGFYVFRADGGGRYVEILEQVMRGPQGLKQWFPFAVAELAKRTEVHTVDVSGVTWCEVDFPVDLQQARKLVATW
jgi:choline kinase